jgi:hypothetical protein
VYRQCPLLPLAAPVPVDRSVFTTDHRKLTGVHPWPQNLVADDPPR